MTLTPMAPESGEIIMGTLFIVKLPLAGTMAFSLVVPVVSIVLVVLIKGRLLLTTVRKVGLLETPVLPNAME